MTRAFALPLVLWLAGGAAAGAQEVTKVIDGETLEVEGVGKVRLVGIAARESSMRLGPSGPAAPPRSGPETPPPPLITGSVGIKPDSRSRDELSRLVLGRRVRLEYDEAANKGRGIPARTCSCTTTPWSTRRCFGRVSLGWTPRGRLPRCSCSRNWSSRRVQGPRPVGGRVQALRHGSEFVRSPRVPSYLATDVSMPCRSRAKPAWRTHVARRLARPKAPPHPPALPPPPLPPPPPAARRNRHVPCATVAGGHAWANSVFPNRLRTGIGGRLARDPNSNAEVNSDDGDRFDNSGTRPGQRDDQAGGITNRPLDEEIANQRELPPRGDMECREGRR